MSRAEQKSRMRAAVWAIPAAFVMLLAVVLSLRPEGGREGAQIPAVPKPVRVEKAEPVTQEWDDVAGEDDEILQAATADVVEVVESEMEERFLSHLRSTRVVWSASLVAKITAESIEETVTNLGDGEEYQQAISFYTGDIGIPPTARQQLHALMWLPRVRRLLAEGRREPDSVIPVLRRALADGTKDWREGRGNEQLARRVLGSTFVLAALGDYDSLPLLLRSYKLSNVGARPPVSPVITLYAMHQLARSYPGEHLNWEARSLREEYLKSSQWLPEVTRGEVPAWPGTAVEPDSWRLAYDRGASKIVRQEMMAVSFYPSDEIESVGLKMEGSKGIDNLFDQLEKFVRAAYPGEEF